MGVARTCQHSIVVSAGCRDDYPILCHDGAAGGFDADGVSDCVNFVDRRIHDDTYAGWGMSVKKVKGGYAVVHCHGKKKGQVIGKPKSKKKALAQHRAIQANKRKK